MQRPLPRPSCLRQMRLDSLKRVLFGAWGLGSRLLKGLGFLGILEGTIIGLLKGMLVVQTRAHTDGKNTMSKQCS